MKISKKEIKQMIIGELKKLTEINEISISEEKRIARYVYILLGEALEKVHDHLGEQEEEPASDEFMKLFDSLAKTWQLVDKLLTGGETGDSLPNLFENNSECTQEEINNAMDVLRRCVMGKEKTTQRPQSREVELGVMPSRVSTPPAGSNVGGVKFVEEGEDK
tara:strand:+ start:2613 stop:3101 length:489 start_codon:yes stop_codon:yes gene_type:complete